MDGALKIGVLFGETFPSLGTDTPFARAKGSCIGSGVWIIFEGLPFSHSHVWVTVAVWVEVNEIVLSCFEGQYISASIDLSVGSQASCGFGLLGDEL